MKSKTEIGTFSNNGNDNKITIGKNKINRGAKIGGSVDMNSNTKINNFKNIGDDNEIDIGGNEM